VARSRRNCSIRSWRAAAEGANLMCRSRGSDRSQRQYQWATCSLMPLAAISIGGSCGPRPLLLPHLCKRQSCADGDYIEDRMPRVGRQAQLVNLLPRSNAHVRRIAVGALLGQLLPSLLGTLRFFMCEALGGSPDQIGCMGQCHISMEHQFWAASRWRHQPLEISPKVTSRGTGYTSCGSTEELSSWEPGTCDGRGSAPLFSREFRRARTRPAIGPWQADDP
jgi:hypothetical protein